MAEFEKLIGGAEIGTNGLQEYSEVLGASDYVGKTSSQWRTNQSYSGLCIAFTAISSVSGAYQPSEQCMLTFKGSSVNLLNLDTNELNAGSSSPWKTLSSSYDVTSAVLFKATTAVSGAYTVGQLCVLLITQSTNVHLLNLSTGTLTNNWKAKTTGNTYVKAIFKANSTVTGAYSTGDLCCAWIAPQGIDLLNLSTGAITVRWKAISTTTSNYSLVFQAKSTVSGSYNTGDLCFVAIGTGSGSYISLLNLATGTYTYNWKTLNSAFRDTAFAFTATSNVAGAYSAGDLCMIMAPAEKQYYELLNLSTGTLTSSWKPSSSNTTSIRAYTGTFMRATSNLSGAYSTGDLFLVVFFSGSSTCDLLNLSTGTVTKGWKSTGNYDKYNTLSFRATQDYSTRWSAGDLVCLLLNNGTSSAGILNFTTGQVYTSALSQSGYNSCNVVFRAKQNISNLASVGDLCVALLSDNSNYISFINLGAASQVSINNTSQGYTNSVKGVTNIYGYGYIPLDTSFMETSQLNDLVTDNKYNGCYMI